MVLRKRAKDKKIRHKISKAKLILNIITLVLIGVILWLAREDLFRAWQLAAGVNIPLILLIIPVQIASYYASTEIFFTFLRRRGQLRKMSAARCTAISLEYNFVNHVFPSAGVSGASYMVWRLGKLGVSAGQAAMSQIINYLVLSGTFIALTIGALIWVSFEDQAANWIVMLTTASTVGLIAIVCFGSYLISSRKRLMNFAKVLTGGVNKFMRKITRGHKQRVLDIARVNRFFGDFYDDFAAIRADKRMLNRSIVWGFISNILNVFLIAIAFWSLGYNVSMAMLFIAFGAASMGSFLAVTPGGVGAYELIMVAVLVAGGAQASVASAGVILARVILVLGTIIFGYAVYQHALNKYGKPVYQDIESIEQAQEAGRK